MTGRAAEARGRLGRAAGLRAPDAGLAPLVLDEISVIDAHEPWLTLIGLRLVFERNLQAG